MTAAATLLRASVKNRVDNQLLGPPVAIHGRRRWERSHAVLLTVGSRGSIGSTHAGDPIFHADEPEPSAGLPDEPPRQRGAFVPRGNAGRSNCEGLDRA